VHGGTAWVIDAFGCAPERLRDPAAVGAMLDEVVRILELTVVGAPQRHAFPPPGGVTALYLLSESHLAIHTFPESGLATIDLYCCRPRAPLDWSALIARALGATRVTVRELVRGAGP
jgi:S-adenosylmethionine decarboxylase